MLSVCLRVARSVGSLTVGATASGVPSPSRDQPPVFAAAVRYPHNKVLGLVRDADVVVFLLGRVRAQMSHQERATEPKVQVPFIAEPGKPPRKIEIERYGLAFS